MDKIREEGRKTGKEKKNASNHTLLIDNDAYYTRYLFYDFQRRLNDIYLFFSLFAKFHSGVVVRRKSRRKEA